MNKIKFKISNNPSFPEQATISYYDLILDPTSVYSYESFDSSKLVIKIEPANGGAETLDIEYPAFTQAYWDENVDYGITILPFANYPGLTEANVNSSDIRRIFMKPQVDALLNRALKGEDTVVDFSVVLPVSSILKADRYEICRAEAEQCKADLVAQLEQLRAESLSQNLPTFRLPKGGGLVDAEAFGSDEMTAYAEKVCGNRFSCAEEALEFNTISTFSAVTLNT